MMYDILGQNKDIVYIESTDLIINDVQSALDLIMSIQYETDCQKIIINKSCIFDDFFVLSTGYAGEILQKFINYHIQIVIVGDYSKYTSKPLRDFIYESNKGKHIYFLSNIDEAIHKLEN